MPIIYRPDYVGDAIANALTYESQKQKEEHDADLAARKKRQKTTAIVGSAVLGAVGGFALAPAAIASAGAGSGFAAGTGLTAAGVPALTGQLAAGLKGASLGAGIGQAIGNEDVAGAIQGIAGAGLAAVDYSENQRIYGYQPTKEGRATTAALAAKAGMSIDRAAQIAQQRGVSVDQVLNEAQGAADDRAIENERYQSAAQVIGRQQGADALDYLNNDIEQFGGNQYAGEPDDGAYMEAQKQRSSIESDLTSGNITRAEANQLATPVRQLVGAAALGRKQRKPPTVTDLQGVQRAPSSMWETDGVVYRTAFDSKGNLQVEKVAGEYSKAPEWTKLPPGPQREEAKRLDREANTDRDADGNAWRRGEKGWEIDKGAANKSEQRAKFIAEIAVTKDGDVRSADEMANILESVDNVDRKLKDRDQLSQELTAFVGSIGNRSIPVETAKAIAELAEQTFSIPLPPHIQRNVDAIVAKSQVDAAAAGMAMAAQAAANAPPPGSAAAAESGPESAGRGAAKALKLIPKAAVKAAAGTGIAAAKAQRGVGQFATGFMEELTGQNAPAIRFANVQKHNIEAGINDSLLMIDQYGHEQRSPVGKGKMTPEVIADLKSKGFTIPGIE